MGPGSRLRPMTVPEAAVRVQFAYPKIYLACHS